MGATGLAATSLLYGCGADTSSGSDSSPNAASGGGGDGAIAGLLNVWGGVAGDKGPQDLCNAFMKKYPNVKIKYTRFVNNSQGILKVDTALQGGVPIDVYFSYGSTELIRRVNAGLALDLTDLAKADPFMKQFVQTDPQLTWLFDGKLYSIPTTYYPTFCYLNKDRLDKAGITIPDGWTVDDYHDIAKELSAPGVYGTFRYPEIAVEKLGGNAWYKDGGKESNFDNPAFKEELDLAVAMEKDGSLFPEKQKLAQKIENYPEPLMVHQKVAMSFNGTSALRYFNNTEEYPRTFPMTFAPEPRPTKGKPFWNTGDRGDSVQISSKSENQKAAWAFVKFWMEEGTPYIAKAGKISPYDVQKKDPDEIVPKVLGPDRDKLYDVDAFKKVYFNKDLKIHLQTIFTANSEISELTSPLVQQVLMQQIPVDQALQKMKSQADAAIKKAL